MILFASNDWRQPSPGFFGDPNGSYYAMIEITLHVPLYIVDVLLAYDDEPDEARWHQYLLSSFQEVMEVLRQIGDAEHEVSVLFPGNRSSDRERVLGTVIEVQQGQDRKHGMSVTVYTLADGRRLFDKNSLGDEDDLVNLTTIYHKKKSVPSDERDDDLT